METESSESTASQQQRPQSSGRPRRRRRRDNEQSPRAIREFYDHFLTHLLQDRIRPNKRHAAIRRIIRRHVQPGDSVLDLGCGIGITTEMIARTGARATGVDISATLIEYARRTVSRAEFIAGDVTELQIRGSYQVVCLFDCLEHVPMARHARVLQAVERVTTSDALLLITIPDMRISEYLAKHDPQSRQIVDEAVDPVVLQQRLAAIGFHVVSMEHYGVDHRDEYLCLVAARVSSGTPVPMPRPSIGRLVWRGLTAPLRALVRLRRRRKYSRPSLLTAAQQASGADRQDGRSYRIRRAGGRSRRRHHRSPHP